MLFTTDRQTLNDLNVFGKHGGDSLFQVFNRTRTRGGAALLEEMFHYPMSDAAAINQRSGIIQYFAGREQAFPFATHWFDAIDTYLANTDERSKLDANERSLFKKLGNLVAQDGDTGQIYKGVLSWIELLKAIQAFLALPELAALPCYKSDYQAMTAILADEQWRPLLNSDGKPSHAEITTFDVLLRFRNYRILQQLLRYVYQLDVYLAVAGVARKKNFAFPVALTAGENLVSLKGAYHPQVKGAVSNNITVTRKENVLFLTGANMAGKSTFMKSVSLALFLAHMGFPVAAEAMEFTVFNGIYTTINLPDNLGMGASHFYAEVLRVKNIAAELAQGRKLFIVFDELFRGTNVKDACEATIAIAEAFAGKPDSCFIISTHIIEAGEVLRNSCSGVRFAYLPTLMNGHQPVYTYKLENGITNDRHGMIIIQNEGILKLLEAGLSNN